MGTYVALAADGLLAVVLGGEGLEGGLDDTTTETEDEVKGGLLFDEHCVSQRNSLPDRTCWSDRSWFAALGEVSEGDILPRMMECKGARGPEGLDTSKRPIINQTGYSSPKIDARRP